VVTEWIVRLRLLLAMRLSLVALGSLSLSLGAGWGRYRRRASDGSIGGRGARTKARLAMLGTALRILAQVIVLGSVVVATIRTLSLRGQAVLLSLRALLLGIVLVEVGIKAAGVRGIVCRVIARSGAVSSTRLLLILGLANLALALECAIELGLSSRSTRLLLLLLLLLLLTIRIERLRGGEG